MASQGSAYRFSQTDSSLSHNAGGGSVLFHASVYTPCRPARREKRKTSFVKKKVQPSGTPSCSAAASAVWSISVAIVIGPTPPGTGVISDAGS